MKLKKYQVLIEAFNAYYAIGLLLYGLGLYISSNTRMFLWIFFGASLIITGWTGFLLRSFLEHRNRRHGFRIMSDVMTYEIKPQHRYTLRYTTTLKAQTNHLMVYPVGYQWTGHGHEGVPIVTGDGHRLVAAVEPSKENIGATHTTPHKITGHAAGDSHYWFIAFNPPLHNGEVVDIKYSQEFHDEDAYANPILYYFVKIPMKRLELNVKFSKPSMPKEVWCSYIKPSDPKRSYKTTGVRYDSEKQWATWVIEKPKKGYYYRIQWQ